MNYKDIQIKISANLDYISGIDFEKQYSLVKIDEQLYLTDGVNDNIPTNNLILQMFFDIQNENITWDIVNFTDFI